MSNIENFKIMQGILDADNEPTVPAPLDPDVIASFRFTETPEQEMINEYKEGKKYYKEYKENPREKLLILKSNAEKEILSNDLTENSLKNLFL